MISESVMSLLVIYLRYTLIHVQIYMYIDVYCNTVYNGTELYSTQRSLHSVSTAIVGQYAAKGK